MSFGAAALESVLRQILPPHASGLVVAVSGGPDSACLLTALGLIEGGLDGLPVRAVHVDHGLQSAARPLRESCERLCARLGLPLAVLEVSVGSLEGESVEAAAREARYGRLSAELRAGECLLTAHHQQDQAETLLLQLLRGAGLAGLAAMPWRRRLGAGWHLRPLLDVPRHELAAFGAEQGISALDDPMNDDPRFERAYLRSTLWPLIESRWPGAGAVLARSAHHLAEAQALLAAVASHALGGLRDGETLRVDALRTLSPAERTAALREWLAESGTQVPSSARLGEALRQMLEAAPDRVPCVAWGEHALRRYRGRLFITPARPPALREPLDWPIGERGSCALDRALQLPAGLGRLRLERAPRPGGLDPTRLPGILQVRGRAGGEVLRIAPGARTQSVRTLCQAWNVWPWMRDALPFVYAGDTLLAVGDLWHNADCCVEPPMRGLLCRWEDAPAIA